MSAAHRRVGLYGGSFNPPHLCHVLTATYAICRGDIEELWVVPAYEHPFAKPMAPFADRLDMTRLALAHLAPEVRVDPIEGELGGTSYTLGTVRALLTRESARQPKPALQFVWVGGADSWATRLAWHGWAELEPLIEPFIIGREGGPPIEAHRGVDVPITLPDVSSTEVRARLASGGAVEHLVPPDTLRFIRARGLYGSGVAPAAPRGGGMSP